MFLFWITKIFAYQHRIIVPPNSTFEFAEKLDLSISSELMYDITVVSNSELNYALIKPGQFRSDPMLYTPFVNQKYREKFHKEGDYTIILENKSSEPVLVSVGSYLDLDQKDEDLSLLTSILNKSKMNLDNLINANLQLKELKEFSLRNAKKDRRMMLLLCILPVLYVLLGFVSLKMQKSFFAPKNRK